MNSKAGCPVSVKAAENRSARGNCTQELLPPALWIDFRRFHATGDQLLNSFRYIQEATLLPQSSFGISAQNGLR